MMKQVLLGALFALAITTMASAETYKMTTPIAPGVAVPDKIESSIGTLNLDYGYPSADKVGQSQDEGGMSSFQSSENIILSTE